MCVWLQLRVTVFIQDTVMMFRHLPSFYAFSDACQQQQQYVFAEIRQLCFCFFYFCSLLFTSLGFFGAVISRLSHRDIQRSFNSFVDSFQLCYQFTSFYTAILLLVNMLATPLPETWYCLAYYIFIAYYYHTYVTLDPENKKS